MEWSFEGDIPDDAERAQEKSSREKPPPPSLKDIPVRLSAIERHDSYIQVYSASCPSDCNFHVHNCLNREGLYNTMMHHIRVAHQIIKKRRRK